MLARLAAALFLATSPVHAAGLLLQKDPGTLRVATFNADMNRKGAGVLIKDIGDRDPQVLRAAEIIRRVHPDILLINEIDWDPQGLALKAFLDLLAQDNAGGPAWTAEDSMTAPVNTGVPSGFDLNGDGKTMSAADAWGFGRFPGQYGMAIAMTAGISITGQRTFQMQRWANAPWATAPVNPDGTPYYAPEVWAQFPLSSKSHWDVRVRLPDGRDLHLLASHPTPPVFDGPEDRNGLRNAAEIRFWIDYVQGEGWMVDDQGQEGGLPPGAPFVILGDLNADPDKGDGDRATMRALLDHPRVQDPAPASPGAAALGAPMDTADWPERNGPGNLRVDYVLPSRDLEITGSGVFWPKADDPLHRLVAIKGRKRASSDHRLVWVDIAMEAE